MKNVTCRKLLIDRQKAPEKVGTLKDISLYGSFEFQHRGGKNNNNNNSNNNIIIIIIIMVLLLLLLLLLIIIIRC